jgi:hypothetical protein
MLENLATVVLDGPSLPVNLTARRRLRQVDFKIDGKEIGGLEQNPDTKSGGRNRLALARKVRSS